VSAPIVGFAGMTHLGLVSATAVASRGFQTICYDADDSLVRRLKSRDLPVSEPDLAALMQANGARQTFTGSAGDLNRCDVVYIAADVPTNDAGESDLGGIRVLIDRIVPVLATNTVLVVLSQVPPGFTRALSSPPPERRYYQVETLVFGRAVERAAKPERFIVGCANPREPLDARLRGLLEAFGCPILPMRYESAELAKISINVCLAASISVANTLAELCEAVGANWSEIVPALKLDRRIGPDSYLSPGLGIAGGNLERDLATIVGFGARHGTDTAVVEAFLGNSRRRRDWAASTLKSTLLREKADPVVAVWGLAYKENTHSIKNSPALATISQLPPGVTVRVHDPVVPASAAGHPRAEGCPEPLEAARGADALMILTPWPQYRAIAPSEVARSMAGRLLLDPYRVMDPEASEAAGLRYYTLGRPAPQARVG
jgi:UDPglucose 6-dehydrogenase